MDERITRYFLGQLSQSERLRLLRDRKNNPKIKEDFATVQNLQAITRLSPTFTNMKKGEDGFGRIEKQIQRKKFRLVARRVTGYAAAIVITFIATRVITTIPQESPDESTITRQELFVPAGQRARLTLPDGSVAWLNAGSTLHYPSRFRGTRKVELTGEGFFEVSKNAEKPFIVNAGEIEIKALGTQFNVSNYPKSKIRSVILTEGSILVYPAGKEKAGQILSPHQHLIIENGKLRLEKNIDMDELLWRDGIYSFKKERMESIVKKLELYFDVKIIIENPRILKYEYTGKFRQCDGVMEILRIIQKIHRYKIETNEEGSKIILY